MSNTGENINRLDHYLVRITPQEPYFFGSERTFGFDVNQNYYIKSEIMPSQTTVLGGLRFALMPNYRSDRQYNDADAVRENAAAIGERSFSMKENVSFGRLAQVSPVFIENSEGKVFIATPFDHKNMRKGDPARDESKNVPEDENKKYFNEKYAPFADYCRASVYDTSGVKSERLLPVDYVEKDHLADSFVSLDDAAIVPLMYSSDDIGRKGVFSSTEKTGIQKMGDDNAFFKRLCYAMMPGYHFAVIISLAPGEAPQDQIVYLGQQKSAFLFEFFESDISPKEHIDRVSTFIIDNHGGIEVLAGKEIYYAVGDLYADSSSIYSSAAGAVTCIRDFRYLETNSKARNYYRSLKKSECLYRLIRAGSVFITEADGLGMLDKALLSNEGCQKIGMNHLAGGKIQ